MKKWLYRYLLIKPDKDSDDFMERHPNAPLMVSVLTLILVVIKEVHS